jgi:hypothetical protein
VKKIAEWKKGKRRKKKGVVTTMKTKKKARGKAKRRLAVKKIEVDGGDQGGVAT